MRWRFDPWVGKIPWRRKWQPTPVFLPREFHGHRNMAGYSSWGRKELDMTEHRGVRIHRGSKEGGGCLGLEERDLGRYCLMGTGVSLER